MQYSLWYVVPNTLLVGDLVTEEGYFVRQIFSVETVCNILERFFTPEVVIRLQYTLLVHCFELLIIQHFHSYP